MRKLLSLLFSFCILFGMMNFAPNIAKINAAENVKIEGDASRLSVEKTTFNYCEPIMVSAVGSGTDWVGVFAPTGGHSIRWFYVEDVGNNIYFDISQASYGGGASGYGDLPPGDYIIRLLPDGEENDMSRTIAWVKITIDDVTVTPPISATYTLDNNTDGFAEGEVVVEVDYDTMNDGDIVMYWGDENGKLKDYTELQMFQITGKKSSYRFPDTTLIPQGATKLLVYTRLGTRISSECVEINLPEGACAKDFGKPLYRYTVCSDVHVTENEYDRRNKNFRNFLADIGEANDGTEGIFIVGDIADRGDERQYKNTYAAHDAVKKAFPNLPPLYLSIGNHDLAFTGDPYVFKKQVDLFCKYAVLPDGSHPKSLFYDFWLNGYHFIFVGNDKLELGSNVNLYDASLKWLDKKIGENYDPTRPTFIFLHQSLYNTVAGSLPGQGWNGVSEGSEFGWRKLLAKYPEAIMFNGHSHWMLNSERNIYTGDPKLPTIVNTASVADVWTSYRTSDPGGHYVDGSEGYTMDIYKDKVILRGREYRMHKWRPSAYYCIKYGDTSNRYKVNYVLNGGVNNPDNKEDFTEGSPFKLKDPTREGYTFEGWFTNKECTKRILTISGDKDITIYAKWRGNPAHSGGTTPGVSEDGGELGGCGATIGGGSAMLIGLTLSALVLLKDKRKNIK